MKKTAFLILLSLVLSSCFDFLPFYKYDADPDPVSVHWKISSEDSGEWRLEESHHNGSANAMVGFNGSDFKFGYNSGSDGRAPVFGNLTVWGSHSPFYTMWEYLDLFLDNFSINTEGYYESGMIDEHRDEEYFRVSNSAFETGGGGVDIPFAALIQGVTFNNYLDPNLLPVPGDLLVYYFMSESYDNAFLQGEGMAVFHNGQPNGLLYMAIRHDTGFVTLIYQENNNNTSTGYWNDMEADYSWFYFPWTQDN